MKTESTTNHAAQIRAGWQALPTTDHDELHRLMIHPFCLMLRLDGETITAWSPGCLNAIVIEAKEMPEAARIAEEKLWDILANATASLAERLD